LRVCLLGVQRPESLLGEALDHAVLLLHGALDEILDGEKPRELLIVRDDGKMANVAGLRSFENVSKGLVLRNDGMDSLPLV